MERRGDLWCTGDRGTVGSDFGAEVGLLVSGDSGVAGVCRELCDGDTYGVYEDLSC